MFRSLEEKYRKALRGTWYSPYSTLLVPEHVLDLMFHTQDGSGEPRVLVWKDRKICTWEDCLAPAEEPESPTKFWDPEGDNQEFNTRYAWYLIQMRIVRFQQRFYPEVPARAVRKMLRMGLAEERDGRIMVTEYGKNFWSRTWERIRQRESHRYKTRKGKGRLPITNYRWRKWRLNRNPSGPCPRYGAKQDTPCKFHKRERRLYVEVEETPDPLRKEWRRHGWKRYKKKESF